MPYLPRAWHLADHLELVPSVTPAMVLWSDDLDLAQPAMVALQQPLGLLERLVLQIRNDTCPVSIESTGIAVGGAMRDIFDGISMGGTVSA
jgi:hypothetical protein